MAKSKSRKYVIDLEVQGGKEAESQLSKVNSELDELEGQGSNGVSVLDDLTGGFGGVSDKAKNVIGSVKGITKGLGTLKGAILATGIGALILALGSLTTWFKTTEAGSDKLRSSTAKLSGVWSEVKLRFAEGGEAIADAIENPGKAWDDFKDRINTGVNVVKALFTLWINDWKIKTSAFQKGILEMRVKWNEFTGDAEEAQKLNDEIDKINETIKGFVKENVEAQITLASTMQEVVNAAKQENEEYAKRQNLRQELADGLIALEKRERQINVTAAERRSIIEQEKLIRDDVNKSQAEREAAAQKAFNLEQGLMNERVSIAAERVRLLKIERDVNGASTEILNEIADAEANLFSVKEESFAKQTELNNSLNAIQAESARQAEEDEAEAAMVAAEMEEVRFALIKEGVDKELAEADRKYEELMLKAHGNAELEKQLEEAKESEIFDIRERWRKENEASEKESNEKALQDKFLKYDAEAKIASQTLGGIATLAEALAEGEGNRAKKAFQVSKALRIAEASANTYTAVTAALAEPTPGRIPRAIAAGAMGLAQVLKIKNTKFQGGGSGGGSISAPSSPVSSQTQQTAQAPQIDFSFLEEQPPAQAYVLSGNVNSQLEANQKIQDQATL